VEEGTKGEPEKGSSQASGEGRARKRYFGKGKKLNNESAILGIKEPTYPGTPVKGGGKHLQTKGTSGNKERLNPELFFAVKVGIDIFGSLKGSPN